MWQMWKVQNPLMPLKSLKMFCDLRYICEKSKWCFVALHIWKSLENYCYCIVFITDVTGVTRRFQRVFRIRRHSEFSWTFRQCSQQCDHSVRSIFHICASGSLNHWVRLPARPKKAAKQSAGGARGTKRCDIEFLDRFCHKCHRCNKNCSKIFLLGVVNFVTNVTDVTRKFQRFSSLRGGSFLILARVAQMRGERFSDFSGRYAKAVLAKYF